MDAIQFHSEQAARWESGYQSPIFSIRLEVLHSLLPGDLTGQLWLDAGCGTGTIARWLAERGARVIAIDASPEMLRHAGAHPRIEYRQANVNSIGLADEMFDGIVSSSVIEYLAQPTTALREFRRLLKADGLLAVSAPHAAPAVRIPMRLIYWITYPLGKHRAFTFLDHSRQAWSAKSLQQMLESCGLTLDRILPFSTLQLPFGIRFTDTPSLLMALSRKPRFA